MGPVGEGHKRQKRPVIFRGWICAFLDSYPRLDFGTSVAIRGLARVLGRNDCVLREIPGMVEGDNAENWIEGNSGGHLGGWIVVIVVGIRELSYSRPIFFTAM